MSNPLLIPGSSRRFSKTEYAMTGVPRAVVESWDWKMRLDPDLLRDPPRGEDALAHLARQRLRHLAPFIRRVPSAAGGSYATASRVL